MTPNERLLGRIREELADLLPRLPRDIEIRRTYAGRRQLETGAWSWFIHSPGGSPCPHVGSHDRVTDLVDRRLAVHHDRNLGSYTIHDGEH